MYSDLDVVVIWLCRRQFDRVGDSIEAGIVVGTAAVLVTPMIVSVYVTIRQAGGSLEEAAHGTLWAPAVHPERGVQIAASHTRGHGIAGGGLGDYSRGCCVFHVAVAEWVADLTTYA